MAQDDGSSRGRPSTGTPISPTIAPSASQPLAQAHGDPLIGQVLDGRYRILSKIGEGGMGEVYACEHIGLKARRAVKLLRPEIVSNEEAVRRFHQEAQSASSIGHKNIIEILDIGELPDKRVYMCMEFLVGAPLSDLIRNPMDPARVLNILIQTCHGLDAAHRQNIVHRDMKPENIFVTTDSGEDVPKLPDFGIAKVSGNDGQNNLTRTGTIFGTPFYMAPEQALGQPVDHRADIYSMGVIMYEIFCGSVPFKAESFMAILTQHITAEPKPPPQMAAECGRALVPGIEEVIVRCMRKDPAQRYGTMEELTATLVAIYRSLGGQIASAYHIAPGSSVHALPATHYSPPPGTPMPGPAQGPYLQGTPMPTPYPGAVGVTSGYAPEVKKSRAGLFALLFLLFLGGGGAAGYVLWQNRADANPSEPGSGGNSANNGKPGTDNRGPGAGGLTPGQDAGAATRPSHASGGIPTGARADAGAAAANPADAAPPARMVKVKLDSKPRGAQVFIAGELIGKTPTSFEVPLGGDTKVMLVKDGFEVETLPIDGSQRKMRWKLSKKHRSSGSGGTDHGGNSSTGDTSGNDNTDTDNTGNHNTDSQPDSQIEEGLIDEGNDHKPKVDDADELE